ncbi:MAG: PmbA/TldA family metallopeptidase, partial [Actinomycetota bacterium]
MADLGELCRTALAGVGGGEQVEAYAAETRKTEVKARRGAIDSLSASESRGVGVRVLVDGRLGYAWAADPDDEEAASLLGTARVNAALGTPDEANALPEPAAADELPGLFREAQASLGPERKVSLALELERAAVSADPAVSKVEEVLYG